jgi:protein-tyrosine phosphatase
MAEALLKAKVAQLGQATEWQISSAGTWTEPGLTAMPTAQTVMGKRGLPLAAHRSRPIDAGLIHNNALVVVMTANHRESLCVDFPEAADKIVMLSRLAGPAFDIDDPVGGDEGDYEVCANEIAQLLDRGFERLAALAEAQNGR